MDKNFFMNSSIEPQIQYDHELSSTMHTWESLSTPMQMQMQIQTNDHFDSTLTSIVSSPTSNPSPSTDNFMIRELIGKLGSICNPNDLPNYINNGNSSTNNSCYNTPLSSPPKLPISPLGNLSSMANDHAFIERAARFSSFGSRSFNGRTSSTTITNQIGVNNCNNNNNNFINDQNVELCNSRENSSISCQNQTKENNGSSRKRKACVSKGKEKDFVSPSKVAEKNGDDSNAKRSRLDECNGKEGEETTKAEEKKGEESGKEEKVKSVDATKDYIHVRARRGQATDSHSLAERVRREKIGERMKLLQDLVPGCNKVTGKALMLEEIINYVQSLQRQVEFLSMKLSNVSPKLEMNMCNLFSKDVVQPNSSMEHPMYQTRMVPTQYEQPQQNHLQDVITTTQCSMDPLNPALINHNHALHLPLLDGFSNYISQLPSLCEGDLQSIVQMGFGQKENGFQAQTLHGPNPTQMKIEF